MCTQQAHGQSTDFRTGNTKTTFSSIFRPSVVFSGCVLGCGPFCQKTFILGSKHILIPAPNSKNFKSYVRLKISKFLDFELSGPRIVGKSVIPPPKTFSENFRQKSKLCQNIVTKHRLSTKLKFQRR